MPEVGVDLISELAVGKPRGKSDEQIKGAFNVRFFTPFFNSKDHWNLWFSKFVT
ncbi:hypothetical protein TNCV_3347501, partial [Trichonephila clavipes]